MKNVLYYFTKKHKGNWEEIYNSLSIKEIIPKDKYLKISMDDISNYTCLIDKDYPNELKNIYKPPFSIFTYGNKKLLNEKLLLGIYGNTYNKDFYDELSRFNNIVYILDFDNKKLINYFINKKINFISICKNGLDEMDKKLFNKIINHNNLVITEMPNENKDVFDDQLHNRIIFGLSKKMLFLNTKTDDLFNTIIEFCKLENVLSFSFKNEKNKYIKKINSLNDIFINCFFS